MKCYVKYVIYLFNVHNLHYRIGNKNALCPIPILNISLLYLCHAEYEKDLQKDKCSKERICSVKALSSGLKGMITFSLK